MPTLLTHVCLMMFSCVWWGNVRCHSDARGDTVPQHTVEQSPVGGYDGMSVTYGGGNGLSDLMGGGDTCGGVLASWGVRAEAVPSLSIWQLWSCAGLLVSMGFPAASKH